MSAKAKNQHLQFETEGQLLAMKDEFENYAGRDTVYDLSTLTLTVLALPKRYKKKTLRENKIRRQRQNRDEQYSITSADEDYSEYGDY